MQGKYLKRNLEIELGECLVDFPVTAILGPRQCGKSTIARQIIINREYVYLDLEKPSDIRKIEEPELFFSLHKDKLICLDEVQRLPGLFEVIRSIVDENGGNGQFLILGSASRDLIKQRSETLAGRIAYLELTPFSLTEVGAEQGQACWCKGGFPRSFLAKTDKSSVRWRLNFIRTFLEMDIPQLGFSISAESLRRLWKMCAHNHGQLLNASQFGQSLGVSHITIKSYIDLLSQTFMVRVLPAYHANIKKRLVKSPKVYIRDSGILHGLLEIDSMDDLIGHPIIGNSWEGFVIENIIAVLHDWQAFFYRTAAGAEIDLLLVRGRRKIAVECKVSKAPRVTKGFWNALADLNIDEAWVIAPVDEPYPIKENVMVSTLSNFLSSVAS